MQQGWDHCKMLWPGYMSHGVHGCSVSWFSSPGFSSRGEASLLKYGERIPPADQGKGHPMALMAALRSGALCWGAPKPCYPQGGSTATDLGWAPRAAVGCRAPHKWSIGINPSGSTWGVSQGSLVPALPVWCCLSGVLSHASLSSPSWGWAASRREPGLLRSQPGVQDSHP